MADTPQNFMDMFTKLASSSGPVVRRHQDMEHHQKPRRDGRPQGMASGAAAVANKQREIFEARSGQTEMAKDYKPNGPAGRLRQAAEFGKKAMEAAIATPATSPTVQKSGTDAPRHPWRMQEPTTRSFQHREEV